MLYYAPLTLEAGQILSKEGPWNRTPTLWQEGQGEDVDRGRSQSFLTSGDSADAAERCGGVGCRVSWSVRATSSSFLNFHPSLDGDAFKNSRALPAYRLLPNSNPSMSLAGPSTKGGS